MPHTPFRPLRKAIILVGVPLMILCDAIELRAGPTSDEPAPVATTVPPPPAQAARQEDFSALASAVARLLSDGDARAFADTAAPSVSDLKAVRDAAGDSSPVAADAGAEARLAVEKSARRLLAMASRIGVDFSALQVQAKALPPRWLGSCADPSTTGVSTSLPWTETVTISLSTGTGSYRLALLDLMKFPAGWRCIEGVEWIAVPEGIGDAALRRDLSLLNAASLDEQNPVSRDDDPSIGDLAEALAGYVRTGDFAAFEVGSMLTYEAVSKRAAELPEYDRPSAADMEGMKAGWEDVRSHMVSDQRRVLDDMVTAGIDLHDAQITVKDGSLERLIARQGAGAIDGIEGRKLRVTFAVRSTRNSPGGANLSGDYALGAEEVVRLGDRWLVVAPLQWLSFPPGVVDASTASRLDVDRYVADHNTLPPGIDAPDIAWTRIADGGTGRLSDLRGKIVVLDFWSTTCGPCQEPLEQMQHYAANHPDWGDRVAVCSISIDDTMEKAGAHLQSRGWTRTLNLWAGPGDWQSAPAKAYRVTSIPTCYVIDGAGRIVAADHPASLHAPDLVDRLLRDGDAAHAAKTAN